MQASLHFLLLTSYAISVYFCSSSSFEALINLSTSSERTTPGWQGPTIVHFWILVQLSPGTRHLGSTYSVQLTHPKLCLAKETALDSVLLPYQHSQS